MTQPDDAAPVPTEPPTGPWSPRAADLLEACRERGLTLAVAESLTGGLVSATLVQVPGASTVLRGAVVAYATGLKATVLGVDAAHLARTGPVDAEVSRQMADGVARLLGADVGLATTGVAGPGPADGYPAGTVHVAVTLVARPGRAGGPEGGGRDERTSPGDGPVAPAGSSRRAHRELHLAGGRQEVRSATVDAVLGLALAVVRETPGPERARQSGRPADAQ